ncbi:MAG: formate/nitrite transporter family protein [Caulobacteraceae bacterium]
MPQPSHESPALSDHEQDQAGDSAALPAKVVHEVIRAEGEKELERDVGQILWSGLAAGLSMGFSFFVEAQLRAGLPDTPWRHLVAALGYTVGFVIVVLGRQQLFTESTLTAVLPLLTRRDLATLLKLIRLWALVLVSNVVGTWLFASLLAYAHPYKPELAPALAALSADTMSGGFVSTMIKAALAGWLIALMVWLLPSAKTARLLIILLITYVVALAELPHIIAGSSEAAFAVLSKQAPVGRYVLGFFLPTLIGNTLGGVIFAALLNHAPVSGEVRDGAKRAG